MNQAAFRNVLINCENLRVLDIQNVSNFNDSHLSAIVELGHSMKKVALGRNVKDLTTESLSGVIRTCRSLKYISMDFNFPIQVPGVAPPVEATPTSSGAASGSLSGAGDDDEPSKENQKHPDLNVLLNEAREVHGGSCYLHAVTDEILSPHDLNSVFPVHRHIEFHFTPIKIPRFYKHKIICQSAMMLVTLWVAWYRHKKFRT